MRTVAAGPDCWGEKEEEERREKERREKEIGRKRGERKSKAQQLVFDVAVPC